MVTTTVRLRATRAGVGRRASIFALLLVVILAIVGARAADSEAADDDPASIGVTPASKGTADDDDGAYDPTEHFDFGDDEDESWFLPDDAMPRVAYEIIDVAANIAEKEAGGTGDIRDESKRQDYHDLAAYYHTQATTIGSFQGREDLHPDGACKREIKQLCAPDAMVDAHLSNVKFTETVAPGSENAAPGVFSDANADADASKDSSAASTITERHHRRARRLMENLEPDPWGVDEDVSDDFAPTEKDLRIRDLEEKVNALAHLVESTKGGAEGIRTKAFESKPHRLFESYFECVHANIIEVHNKRARHVVGPECRAEVRETYSKRFADVRADARIMEACGGGHKGPTHNVEFAPDPDDDTLSVRSNARGEAIAGGDISKFCSGVKPGLGLIFRCLKAHKAELEPGCAKVVGFRQIEEAQDVSLDAPLALMCEDDRAKLCADTEWGGGATEQCLKDKRAELSTQCKLEVFRREVEESEDVRYDAFLSDVCAADVSAFCDDVKPGDGRVMACLESHLSDAKFSADCRAVLDRRVVRRAADWRLDFNLRKACVSTVKSMCRPELDAAKSKVSSSGSVLECLKRKLSDGDIDDESCKAEVDKKMVAAAGDIREDTSLTLACKAELTEHCGGVQPGEGRLWTCLAARRAKASPECESKLFEREVWMSGDWRFKFALKSKCAAEAQLMCQGVAPGGGRVIKCLQSKLDDPKMGKECRAAVFSDQSRAHADIRLHQELSSSCAADVKELCTPVNPGEGRVIDCLKAKRASVKRPDCRNALLRLMMSQADNYLLDAPLAAACHDDVVAHCSDVQPGQGRVHECLRAIPNALSPACKEAELSAEAREAEDIRLKPQLLEACQASGAQLCADVKPGHGRLLECLLSKAEDPDMDQTCAKRLTRHAERQNKHMLMNVRARTECEDEVSRLCGPGDDAALAAAADDAEGVEDPFECLVSNADAVKDVACASALRRTVRLSLRFYRLGVPSTRMCDEDARRACGVSEDTQTFQSPGSVLSCLQRGAAKVNDACWSAVAAALPAHAGDDADAPGYEEKQARVVEELRRKVETEIFDEVSERMRAQSGAVQATAARAAQMMQAKTDSLASMVALVGFGLLGVAAVAYLALRRLFALLARQGGKGHAHRRAHNV